MKRIFFNNEHVLILSNLVKVQIPKEVTPLPSISKPDCQHGKADIIFVLDSSTSVGPENWKLQLQFVNDLTHPLKIGRKAVRVALVTFNTDTKIQFGFDRFTDSRSLQQAVRRIKFTEGVTFTGEALSLVLRKVVPKMRPGVPRLLFLVTDGRPNGEVDPNEIASKLKRRDVKIFTVGIGDADK